MPWTLAVPQSQDLVLNFLAQLAKYTQSGPQDLENRVGRHRNGIILFFTLFLHTPQTIFSVSVNSTQIQTIVQFHDATHELLSISSAIWVLFLKWILFNIHCSMRNIGLLRRLYFHEEYKKCQWKIISRITE